MSDFRGGMPITPEICDGCAYQTTKMGGFEVGIKRCSVCGCSTWAKNKILPKCPLFKNMDEYEKKNGKRF